MKIIVDTKENISKYIAEAFAKQLCEKPESSVAFTADKSLDCVLSGLNGSFEKASFFNVCDFEGGETMNALNDTLSRLSFGSVHSPKADNAEDYDEHIAAHGGLDMILLGMSLKGTIGFNEPTTAYDTHTHVARLTDVTKQDYKELFADAASVPDTGVTMGLKTICDASTAIVAAFGSEKADIVYKLVYGKTTTYVPAAMLQMHRDMILCLDEEAAAKL